MVMISGYKTNKRSSNVIHHRVWIDATRYIIFKFVKSTHDCLHWKLSFLMKLCLFPVHFGCRFFYRKINLIKTAHGTKFITPFAYASRWIKAINKKALKSPQLKSFYIRFSYLLLQPSVCITLTTSWFCWQLCIVGTSVRFDKIWKVHDGKTATTSF